MALSQCPKLVVSVSLESSISEITLGQLANKFLKISVYVERSLKIQGYVNVVGIFHPKDLKDWKVT